MSFNCQIIFPSFLDHIWSNSFHSNFVKWQANDFNVALHQNEKCLTTYNSCFSTYKTTFEARSKDVPKLPDELYKFWLYDSSQKLTWKLKK